MSRAAHLALACAAIAAGLLVHFRGGALDAVSRDVLGDLLWAAMIYWWIGVVTPSTAWLARAVAALAVGFAVELSQLSALPVLVAVRATRIGHLVLGSGFDPRDFAAYAAGVAAAAAVEGAAVRRARARSRAST